MKKKTVAILMACVLMLGCVMGGTLAWLTDKTDEVVNTFTVGDIDITLTETPNTDSNNDNQNDCWSAILIPGNTYKKDPVVSVTEDSEDCYLFVKFEEINDPSTYLTYTSTLTGSSWALVPGETNVWYRVVFKTDETKTWHLLEGDTVTVKDTVVKAGTAAETTADDVDMPENGPQLKYTAYAVQKENLSVGNAWAKVKP